MLSADRRSASRPTIGLFITGLTQPWTRPQWWGVADGAQRRNANLICFPGGLLRARHGYDAQANVLYDLANSERLDGLVLWTAGFDSYISPTDVVEFAARYRSIPIVSVEHPVAGIPSVLMDNHDAVHDLVAHLIEVHGYRRIAFIQSNATSHPGIAARYEAYGRALVEYGIPFDPSLVSPPFYFETRQNPPALTDWITKVQSEGRTAVVGFNDIAALGALEVIQSLGIRVPEDMALTGFDDIDEGHSAIPPLTTARPPFHEMGVKAVEMLFALMEAKTEVKTEPLPVHLVIRRSCGCQDSSVVRAAAGSRKTSRPALKPSLVSRKRRILAAMVQDVGDTSGSLMDGWLGLLWDGFLRDVNGRAEGSFLKALEEILYKALIADADILPLQEAISALRRSTVPDLAARDLRRTEDLWQQARVMIGGAARRQEAARGQRASNRMDVLREIQAALLMTFDVQGLMNVLTESLPRLGIPGCYLSVYESPRPYRYPQSAPESSRLLLAFNARGRLELAQGGPAFLSHQLVPDGIWPGDEPFSFVAESIYFQDDQLGFALFEVGSREGAVYGTLRDLISSALEGALLMVKQQKRAAHLQAAAAVSHALSAILEPGELIRKVVSLIADRFNLSSVDLFMVDDTTGGAIHQAGTGDEGYAAGDESRALTAEAGPLVSACVAEARTVIGIGATDHPASVVSADRSEMALPLVSRAQVTGALLVRCAPGSSFSDEEVRVLQTMADQTANAVENARLHAKEQERSRELSDAYRALKENQERSLISQKMASLGRLTAGIAHEMNTLLAALRTSLVEIARLADEYESSIGDAQITSDDHREIAGEMKSSIRLANTAAERAAGFVRGIKTQTRNMGKVEQQRFNAVPVIEEALLLLSHDVRKAKCAVSFQPAADQVDLIGSPGRLAQVVTNLVTNALDASEGRENCTITLTITPRVDGTELRVSDKGMGIPPENLSRIFDPLFTTKPTGQGTGLGLTIVHDIITGEFGAAIEVASVVDQGTTFTIRFPKVDDGRPVVPATALP